MIEVDLTGFMAVCQHLINQLPTAIDSALDKIGEAGVKSASTSTLYKGNGHLRKNIKYVESGQLAKAVVADTPYAYYVEFGNNQKGDKIYPKQAKALRFQVDGQTIFRKWVKAHGPIPFMSQAREEMMRVAPNAIRDALQDLVNRG